MTAESRNLSGCVSIDGKVGDRIEIKIEPPEYVDQECTIRCWRTSVNLSLQSTTPGVEQLINSQLYGLPALADLSELVAGDYSKHFVFDAEGFKVEIYEIRHGVRSGFVVTVNTTTIRYAQHSPWPESERFAEHLLIDVPSIGNVRAAFLVDYEQVTAFLKAMEDLYRQVNGRTGNENGSK